MATALSLNPIFRRSVGFDRFDELFNQLSQADDSHMAYPPYNIEKHGENDYVITMAVAGFKETDLSITAHNNELKIAGRIESKEGEDEVEYLHRGIATRAFERTFSLADFMQVKDAQYKDGLLHVALQREVPEEAKPRLIPIRSDDGALLEVQ